MKIISKLKYIAKESTAMRILMRNVFQGLCKMRYLIRGMNIKVDEKLIVFGAYNGKSYACSPRAVYEEMIQSKDFEGYTFVWIFDNPEEYDFLKSNENTIVVKNKSKECEKYLHRAKYWIFNFRALDFWVPSSKQVYVQCWHGTPLKRLGFDIVNSDNAMNSVREIRSKYVNDTKRLSYLISSCPFVTEAFSSAWNLKGYGKDNAILEIGYPRNDFLSNYDSTDVEKIKKSLGISSTDKKIILYAPTWRDNQYDAELGYVYKNDVNFDKLKDLLSDEYIILFRAHYLVADRFNFSKYDGFIYNVSDIDDINDLYIISDILITDYSSVFFDYAILERPMFFYMYDMEEYRDEMRGFYLDIDELPGPIVKTEVELAKAIENCNLNNDVVKNFNKKFNDLNDGNAAKRLIDKVIKIN